MLASIVNTCFTWTVAAITEKHDSMQQNTAVNFALKHVTVIILKRPLGELT